MSPLGSTGLTFFFSKNGSSNRMYGVSLSTYTMP